MNEPQLSAEMERKAEEVFEHYNGDGYANPCPRIPCDCQVKEYKHFLATALEEQRATFVDEVKNRKATIKWLWGKQKTDDECFLMVMEQVQKIADILNGKE